jgi:hypothetical protein
VGGPIDLFVTVTTRNFVLRKKMSVPIAQERRGVDTLVAASGDSTDSSGITLSQPTDLRSLCQEV